MDQLGIVDDQRAVDLVMEEFIQGRNNNSEELTLEDSKMLKNITKKMKEQFNFEMKSYPFTKIAGNKCQDVIIQVCKCEFIIMSDISLEVFSLL